MHQNAGLNIHAGAHGGCVINRNPHPAQPGDSVNARLDQRDFAGQRFRHAHQPQISGLPRHQPGQIALGDICAQFQRPIADQGEHRLTSSRRNRAQLRIARGDLSCERGGDFGARQLQIDICQLCFNQSLLRLCGLKGLHRNRNLRLRRDRASKGGICRGLAGRALGFQCRGPVRSALRLSGG